MCCYIPKAWIGMHSGIRSPEFLPVLQFSAILWMLSNCSYSYSKHFVTHSVFCHKMFLLFLLHSTTDRKTDCCWDVWKPLRSVFFILLLFYLFLPLSIVIVNCHSIIGCIRITRSCSFFFFFKCRFSPLQPRFTE